jgi:hypothetical protein
VNRVRAIGGARNLDRLIDLRLTCLLPDQTYIAFERNDSDVETLE